MKKFTTSNTSPFDTIRHVENEQEYWSARELQELMGYTKWDRFEDAIERAKIACKNSGHDPERQITGAGNLLKRGKYAQQEQKDYRLTRYACYLVAMNSDPRKEAVSLAQTYFAVKTREAEVARSQPQVNNLWQQRLTYFHHHTHIPEGYWCVFGFAASHCWTEEFKGVQLLEDALPDGSVGKRWCGYLREHGYNMDLIKKYPHHYPDKRGTVQANIYPDVWLSTFWTWFHQEYLKKYYPTYLQTHTVHNQLPKGKKARKTE